MLTHKQLRAKALGRTEVEVEFKKQEEEFALLDEFLILLMKFRSPCQMQATSSFHLLIQK